MVQLLLNTTSIYAAISQIIGLPVTRSTLYLYPLNLAIFIMYSLSSILKPTAISALAIAIIGIDLASHDHQAQAISFRIGYNGASGLVDAGSSVVRGQSFQVQVTGSFSDPGGGVSGTLNSIKFLYNNATAATASASRVLIYSTIPSLTDLNAGIGFIAASSGAKTIVAGNTDTDFPSASATTRSVRFDFASSPVLNAGTTYYALFESGQLIQGTGPTDRYAGGDSYVANPSFASQPGYDRAFVVNVQAVPFEFEATGGVLVVGGLFALHRLRKLKRS